MSLLGLLGAGLAILLQDWIAGWLLGDSNQGDLVAIAGVLGGFGAIFKLTEIIIWFEGRGWTYVIVDALRPTLNLVFMGYLIAHGEGVKGAITGAAIGTGIAVLVSVVVLVRSFEFAFEFREVGLIVQRGVYRMPIAMSMYTIQNADAFLLSRFVDHKQVGYYRVAQQLGFIVSFLPQGFRIALRPLRKTAMFQAVRDQYGSAVAKGQLLIYFILIAIFAILAMVLGGELLINVAGGQYAAAAPLIPLTAAMMTMPALFRTVNGQTFFPHKRAWFISCVIFAALSFVGWMYLLVPALRHRRHAGRLDPGLRPAVGVPLHQEPARQGQDRVPLPGRARGDRDRDRDRRLLRLRAPLGQVAPADRGGRPARPLAGPDAADRDRPADAPPGPSRGGEGRGAAQPSGFQPPARPALAHPEEPREAPPRAGPEVPGGGARRCPGRGPPAARGQAGAGGNGGGAGNGGLGGSGGRGRTAAPHPTSEGPRPRR